MNTSYILYRLSYGPKEYYGMTKFERFKKRMNAHSRSSTKTPLSRAIRKHGWENFTKEVLAIGGKSYIQEMEISAIDKFNSKAPAGYNVTSGGEHFDPSGVNHWCFGRTGEDHPAYGNIMTEEARRRISAYQRGKNTKLRN